MGLDKEIEMRGSLVAVSILFCLASTSLSEEAEGKRAGKIFYVTTTSSISTVNTVTFCHVLSSTADGLYTCAARRRRALKFNTKSTNDNAGLISPSRSGEYKEDPENDLQSSHEEASEREGRFVKYWITTTFTSTTTSYTATSSIGSIICTPNGWTYANCPANGK